MPFCAQILDAALFLPGVSAPVTADFSWSKSAGEYLEIYGWITGK